MATRRCRVGIALDCRYNMFKNRYIFEPPTNEGAQQSAPSRAEHIEMQF